MCSIIIGFSNSKKCAAVKELLHANGFEDIYCCGSGDEVIDTAKNKNGGVIICAPNVGKMSCMEIYDYMPDNYGMVALVTSSQIDLVSDNDNIFKVMLPVNRGDLIRTVNMVMEIGRKNGGGQLGTASVKNTDEKIIIERAKLFLMNKYHITETAAHRYIQKNSMDRGLKRIDVAKKILNY